MINLPEWRLTEFEKGGSKFEYFLFLRYYATNYELILLIFRSFRHYRYILFITTLQTALRSLISAWVILLRIKLTTVGHNL